MLRYSICVCVSFSLVGCAAKLQSISVSDEPAGYAKVVMSQTELATNNQVIKEEVEYSSGSVSSPAKSSFDKKTKILTSRFILRKTAGDAKNIVREGKYTLTYRRNSLLPTENLSKEFRIVSSAPPKLSLTSPPACIHVGDKITLAYVLRPAPRFAKLTVRSLAENNGCVELRTRGNSKGSITIQPTCPGANSIGLKALAGGALVAKASTIDFDVKPALTPPGALDVKVGEYTEPEEGPTEGQDGTTPAPVFRRVTLEWSKPPGSTATVFRIFKQSSKVPVQEGMIEGDGESAALILAAGVSYRVAVRSRYAYCSEGEWSEYMSSSLFEVPN